MEKRFKPKTKEKWTKATTIKIKKFIEITENPKDCFTPKVKLINVGIIDEIGTTIMSMSSTIKHKREILREIGREL